MVNIVLCGGSGMRLWPLSRRLMPKQFLPLFNGKSLFQLGISRNAKICDKCLIVSNSEHYFLAVNQLEQLGNKARYLLEPLARNTAAAIALGCLVLDKDDIVLVTPSDQLIKDKNNYQQAVKQAQILAQQGSLVTFGVKPSEANTAFGYMQVDGFKVEEFCEKPDDKTAFKYLAQGNYYWNAGIFCFKAGVLLAELKTYAPDIYHYCQIAFNNCKQDDVITIKADDMANIPSNSIDFAVLEKSNIIKMVALDAGWSDVGSFDTLSGALGSDDNNNLIISDKVVKTIDIKDSIIIDSGDALLVCPKKSAQQVKTVISDLKVQQSQLLDIGLATYRPWGSYTILGEHNGYKIKRIEVLPHKRLSLQSHKYRNEHWVVVSGEALVRNGDNSLILKQNQSTYIQAGNKHRLENNSDNKLIIIEVQVGSYTGEDDIERFDDDFVRT